MSWFHHIIRIAIAGILLLTAAMAKAQISDSVVRIGVLNDQSGVYSDHCGAGSIVAARMAIEDAGGRVLGKPVEIVYADHQNKPDIAAGPPPFEWRV